MKQLDKFPTINSLTRCCVKSKLSKPLLSEDEFKGIEKTWAEMGIGRRCQLGLFTKTGKFIIDKIAKDREFAVLVAQILHHTRDTMNFYEGLLQLMKTAEARTSVALCYRTDMDAVLAEGREQYLAGDPSDMETTHG